MVVVVTDYLLEGACGTDVTAVRDIAQFGGNYICVNTNDVP